MRKHAPDADPDGFHDLMTLLERVTNPYVDFKIKIDEQAASRKAGHESKEKAMNAHSFTLTLPGVLGKQRVGAKTKATLPALPSYDHWNPNNGLTGIERDTTKQLSEQVIQAVGYANQVYGDSLANKLALGMISASKNCWVSLASCGNLEYHRLHSTSGCTGTKAWSLVSDEVLGFIEELHRAQMQGVNAKRNKDKFVQCARYLWFSLQGHRVMQAFLRVEFRGHPIIAPIVNLHLFKHRVPTAIHNKTVERVKKLREQLGQYKKDIDRITQKVTKLS